MNLQELLEKKEKIITLEQEIENSISLSVSDYDKYFYFKYDIEKTDYQTKFYFTFFIPEVEVEVENQTTNKKVKLLEFATTGFDLNKKVFSEAVTFFNKNGTINNNYAFLMMNSKDYKVSPENSQNLPYLKGVHLEKNDTNLASYEKSEATLLNDFLNDINKRFIFPILEENSKKWPTIMTDYKEISNNLIKYLKTNSTKNLNKNQTSGLIEIQNYYEKIKLNNKLDSNLSQKIILPKIKI